MSSLPSSRCLFLLNFPYSVTQSPSTTSQPPVPYKAACTPIHISVLSLRDASWGQSSHLAIWEAIVHPPCSLFSCLCKSPRDISRHNYCAKYYSQSLSDHLIILWVLFSEASHNPIISPGSWDDWSREGGGGIMV